MKQKISIKGLRHPRLWKKLAVATTQTQSSSISSFEFFLQKCFYSAKNSNNFFLFCFVAEKVFFLSWSGLGFCCWPEFLIQTKWSLRRLRQNYVSCRMKRLLLLLLPTTFLLLVSISQNKSPRVPTFISSSLNPNYLKLPKNLTFVFKCKGGFTAQR